jgi:hypothetical protein
MSLVYRVNGLHFYLPPLSINRAGQRLPSQQTEAKIRQGDSWNEIDRRNQRVLHPLNAKESYGTQNHLPAFHYQRNKLSNNSFNLESYHSYCHRRRHSLQRNDSLEDSSLQFQKGSPLTSINDTTFLYGNSVIKSNKADILHRLEQQSNNGENGNTFVNKYGVIIGEDGPFWPCDFRILHPTPKLLSRELIPKEFYLTVTNSSLLSK